jgi:hypothetical protein
VELDVGHVAACNWSFPFARYHEPIVGGVGTEKQNWFLFLPQFEHWIFLVKME